MCYSRSGIDRAIISMLIAYTSNDDDNVAAAAAVITAAATSTHRSTRASSIGDGIVSSLPYSTTVDCYISAGLTCQAVQQSHLALRRRHG